MVGNDTSWEWTTDSASGLDWLDMSYSLGQTCNQVVGQMDTGEAFAGWRYATGDEIINFWEAATGGNFPGFNTDILGWTNTVGDWTGYTYFHPEWGVRDIIGISADLPTYSWGTPVGYHSIIALELYTAYGKNHDFAYWDRLPDAYSTNGTTFCASWLVRDTPSNSSSAPVPEPATMLLFGAGLASAPPSTAGKSNRLACILPHQALQPPMLRGFFVRSKFRVKSCNAMYSAMCYSKT